MVGKLSVRGDIGQRTSVMGGEQRVRQSTERRRPSSTLIVIPPSNTTIGTAATTIYTVPANRFFLIEEMTLTNVAVGTETVEIYFVESGGSAGTTNAVIYQEQYATATSYRLTTVAGLMLAEGDILQAKTSSAGGVNITLWGSLISGS